LFHSFRLALCGLAGRRFWIGGACCLLLGTWTDLKIGHYIFGFAGLKPSAYIYPTLTGVPTGDPLTYFE
jgi:hypothetical protein